MLLLLILGVIACEDTTVPMEPAPDDRAAPVLVSGTYEVQIYGVEAMACPGVRPQDLIGEATYADLEVRGDGGATLNLEGWALHGDMAGGNLYVEGSAEYDQSEPDEPRGDRGDDDDSDGDAGGDVSEDPPPPCDVEPEEEGEDRDDRPDEDRPADAPFASLDAVARDAHLADGRLSMSMEGCAMDLEVVMVFVGPQGGGEEPPVVMEDVDEDAG